ncbi:hypothetical protein NG798_17095 [Ancylothrix sp. C2]|uniref:glutaredoxin family protein n=1 Tax=Ancylothrix sp. D3o TaxID=2953691 RepID=UPI0021BB2968|nr:hypothetical protein [Ancylothrix sp. D3o]MCT7951522.1 hypothetical protein [Ancylothrix sp. D3o]
MKVSKISLFLGGAALGFLTLGSMAVSAGSLKISLPQSSSPLQLAQGETGPAIKTTSGPSELALGRHLKSLNAKMYAAYWCPYCHVQKDLFGKEAFASINYIECDPKGRNAKPEMCRQANIKGFPTWEINGKFYPGMKSLKELSTISNYKGEQNFKNKVEPPNHSR